MTATRQNATASGQPVKNGKPPKAQKHLETVEDLKRRGFTDPAMRNWTFEHDNGRNPQTETARFYVENWETMQAENIGYLLWGGVGTGKSYLAGCIANALMEQRSRRLHDKLCNDTE